jgi:glucosamine-6-phosphate deaminase
MRGDTGNAQQETARYNELVNKQPMDLIILGIGPGGHMAFNEPGTAFTKQTHVAPLSAETISRDVMRGQPVHTHALTVGIANILQAKQAVMVGYGENNGKEFANVVHGPVSEKCPASALQRISDRVTILCDTPAARAMRST